MTKTVTLPDGYNGHTVECLLDPIEQDGDMVKLQVKCSSMIKWVRISEWYPYYQQAEYNEYMNSAAYHDDMRQAYRQMEREAEYRAWLEE